MSALQMNDIQKQYGADDSFRLVVEHIEVKKGELFALLGPSGCGKTTLLKLIAGLEQADAGELYADGRLITGVAAEKRGFGMVFQQALLFPHMSVEDNVAFGLKMKGMGKAARLEKARVFLERAGLSGFEQRFPHELSGGQQQRVSLVRSLVLEPTVLLMDEPFSALDPGLREEMQAWLRGLHEDMGVTIVLVTHDRAEAFALADRVGVMSEGRLLQVDAPERLYRQPASVEVARFLGLNNLIRGKLEAGQFVATDADWQTPFDRQATKVDQAGWLLIPPYAARIATYDQAQAQAEVIEVRFLQGAYHLELQIGHAVRLEIIETSRQAATTQRGDRIGLNWDPADLYFIEEEGTVHA
ncbi:hypothetical protein BEP19_14630 [Ammoniphilus oxalaticus]|uniref:Carnitine transport ATP-binding protein OpuCA n=1 Tax=Ammoniphilus oxalaticus TaxID=66863 RepID=A0A419SEU8_9BACL|nr:ABC transporter ATP-binding protein [Ammoniphilus oxalaticus]RKD21843.1 hypothetical protein BEP19_14630 [Ammoniphilus oxalaticus]